MENTMKIKFNTLPKGLIKSSPICFIDDDSEEVEIKETDDGLQNEETQEGEEEQGEQGEEESEEVTITIGDEEEEEEKEEAPGWVKELRQKNRELSKKNRQLEKDAEEKVENKALKEIGEEPKIEDFDYNQTEFLTAHDGWRGNKKAHEDKKATAVKDAADQTEQWNAKLASYKARKSELKVADYEEAEEEVTSNLSLLQQSVIISLADKPEQLMYALGKNPKVLKELADTKDAAQFIYKMAKIETQVKAKPMVKRFKSDKIPSGGGSKSGSNKTLDNLRDAAAKSGDYSEVIKYKRELKTQKAG